MVKCQPYKYNKLPCKFVRHVNLGCFTETGSRTFVSIQCRLPWHAHRAVLATILHLTSRWRRAIKSFGNFSQCFREPSPHLWTEHFSFVPRHRLKKNFRQFIYWVATVLAKFFKVLELAKAENSRPWKVLEFGLRSLKILEWADFLPSTAKNHQNEQYLWQPDMIPSM